MNANQHGQHFGSMPMPPHSQFNHDFLDDLIPPVTAGMDNMGGPPGGHPNHFFDNHHPYPPTSGARPPMSYANSPQMAMGPHPSMMAQGRMPVPGGPGPHMGPGGPMAHPSTGKVYPPNQSMVFNPSNPNAPPIYPCGVCHKEVHDNDQAILCESGCNFWFHRACTGLSEPAFVMLKEEVYAEWVCDKCLATKAIPLVKLKP